MIDFEATRAKIEAHIEANGRDWGSEHQVAAQMKAICKEVGAGQLQSFDANDTDAFSCSFVGWTHSRGLLVTA